MKCSVVSTIRTHGPCTNEAVTMWRDKPRCAECIKEMNYIIRLGRMAEVKHGVQGGYFANEPLVEIPSNN